MRIGRDSLGLRPSRRSSWRVDDDDDDDDDFDDDEEVPRAAERMKDRSGRERMDVSSLGVMYCIVDACC